MQHASSGDPRRAREVWREGVDTFPVANAALGSRQLTVFTQECVVGMGAPLHVHVVEEVLQVLDGQATITVGNEQRACQTGDVVIIPAGVAHGFVNTSTTPLHMLAILASPIFEARYLPVPGPDDDPDHTPPRDVRRWSS